MLSILSINVFIHIIHVYGKIDAILYRRTNVNQEQNGPMVVGDDVHSKYNCYNNSLFLLNNL